MKRLILFLFIILLVSCGTDNEALINDLENQVGILEEEILTKDEIINQKEKMLKIIDREKNIEISGENIYIIRENYGDGNQGIVKWIDRTEDESSKVELFYKSEEIHDFKVSQNNEYIVVTSSELNNQKFEMIHNDGRVVFAYSYMKFIDEVVQTSNLENEKIHILDFSHGDSALWGGIGGELDMLISFIYIIEDNEFIVFNESNRDLFLKYSEKYPLE